ncbi:MAG TPA: cytochrome c oxidase assembly protein [Alphaproteobacteria bacterium]|nr:cytochrome c oxidase assembly protein [Alphaproteobacteria bacterium]
MKSPANNRRTALWLAGVVLGMVVLSFASVPLYGVFCRVTGYGGTPQLAEKIPKKISPHHITVRFNTDVAPGLAWEFQPEQPQMDIRLGEVKGITYRATNISRKNQVGVAVYHVQPERAGLYFNKVQCFCFNQQPLAAGQSASLPVQFFVDPAIEKDPQLEGVDTITLSYTFFAAKSPHLAEAQKSFEAWEKRLTSPAKTP